MRDDAVLDAALAVEAALAPVRSDAPAPRPRADMRVAVIGAGVIGVTTAYELGADGHEVTVFERRGTVAAESSFANAGLVAPGYVSPWSAPGMPGKVISHLWREHAPVRFGGRPDLVDHRLAVALVARLQAGDLPRQPGAHASPRPLQPRPAARADGAAAARLRARRRLSRPAALAARPGAGRAGHPCPDRARGGAAAARRRRLPPGRAGPQSRDRAPRRRLLEGRRGRQLPRVHPPAAQGGGARRRPVPLRDAGRADHRRGAAGAWSSRARRAIRATRPCRARAPASAAGRRPSPRTRWPAKSSFDAVVVCAALGSGAAAPAARRAPAAAAGLRLLGDGAAAPRRRSTCTSSPGRR